ncbi:MULTISPECIES: hypothetical protein [Liquorilactobacillus]|uniref:hypothetical protein n=1 Tax=Liquorilactobacillus TaxID=2767888 RepID=UPI001E502DB5|nr:MULTISPECIES: hypothetical protein [Liquorilactobacillus]MCC7667189.1 hypothetical protein [Liquorilactobacillus satsumensis]MCP9314994.1 hypothetical protein [Liquorilactobacillus nagelii]
MKYLRTYFTSAYISLAVIMSILFGFTVDWHWHTFQAMYSLKLFGGIILITFLVSIPAMVGQFFENKRNQIGGK